MNTIRSFLAEAAAAAQSVAAWLWVRLTAAARRVDAALADLNDVYPDDIADQLPQMARDLAEIEALWILPAHLPSHERN